MTTEPENPMISELRDLYAAHEDAVAEKARQDRESQRDRQEKTAQILQCLETVILPLIEQTRSAFAALGKEATAGNGQEPGTASPRRSLEIITHDGKPATLRFTAHVERVIPSITWASSIPGRPAEHGTLDHGKAGVAVSNIIRNFYTAALKP